MRYGGQQAKRRSDPVRAQHGLRAQVARIRASRAAYGILTTIVRGRRLSDAQRASAALIPRDAWERVLDLEGCAAWVESARRRTTALADVLGPALPLIRPAGERALRNAVAMVQQLAELAPVAGDTGVRVLVLKGSARLLAGEIAGSRTMADIDLLVAAPQAAALHAALQSKLGYVSDPTGTPGRHLPSLVRADSLPVEIHERLADAGSPLDARIWEGTRSIPLGGATLEIPSALAVWLHTLEHAVVVHRTLRYRLRDIIDLSTSWNTESATLDAEEAMRFVAGHEDHRALTTMVMAAVSLGMAGWDPDLAAEGRAWRRIGRVGRARLIASPQPGVPAGADPRVLALSQIAEGAPGAILRLIARGLSAPWRAVEMVAGRWLPPEAERARASSSAPPGSPDSQ
jgi:Uncharacterised nucleotidyltransferase